MKAMKRIRKLSLLVALLGTVAVVLILFGARLGLWQPIIGFGLYRTYLNPLGYIILTLGLFAICVHFLRKETQGIVTGGIASILGATTSLEYRGPELAAAQAKGYPDIAPL